MQAYRLLSNGSGSWDWAGLGLVCSMLGVADPELLVHRMTIIKHHRAPKTAAEATAQTM